MYGYLIISLTEEVEKSGMIVLTYAYTHIYT